MRQIRILFILVLAYVAFVPSAWPCVTEVGNAGSPAPAPEVWPGPMNEEQEAFLTAAAAEYGRSGTLMKDDNCFRLFNVAREKVVAIGDFAPGRVRANEALFKSPYHFWVSFDAKLQREIVRIWREYENRMWSDEVRAAYQRFCQFNIFLVRVLTDDSDTYPESFLTYLDERRETVLKRIVFRAVDHFQRTNELIDGKNCKKILGITWKQLMGMDYHTGRSATEKSGFRRMTANRGSFWKLFDTEVQRRLAKFEGEPKFLEHFSIYDVKFEPRSRSEKEEEHEVPDDVVALFDQHRADEKLKYAKLIVDSLQTGGEMVNQKNCTKLLKVNWHRLLAITKYGPGKPTYYRRIFDSLFELYIWVERERLARLDSWPMPVIGKNVKREARDLQESRLAEFNFLDFPRQPFYSKGKKLPDELEAIFVRHRERSVASGLEKLVAALERDGTVLTRANCRSLLGIDFEQLIGLEQYRTGAVRWRWFESIDKFAAAYEWEVERRRSALRTRYEFSGQVEVNLNRLKITDWLFENRRKNR